MEDASTESIANRNAMNSEMTVINATTVRSHVRPGFMCHTPLG